MAGKGKLTRLIRKNSRLIFYTAVVAGVLIYLAARIIPAETVFIESEAHPFGVDAKVYVFKEEQYVVLNNAEGINLLCEEGRKLSASTLLSDNYVLGDTYIQKKIAVLDYMLSLPDMDTAREIYAAINEKQKEEEDLQAQLDAAVAAGDEAAKSDIAGLLENCQYLSELLEGGLAYAGMPYESMVAERAAYAQLLGRTDLPLTADNLGFTVFGRLAYWTDGYEGVMGFNCGRKIDADYLAMIDSMAPAGGKSDSAAGRIYIKSSSADRTLLAVTVPADTYIAKEEKVADKYAYFYDNYDIDLEGGYYNFLYRRIDVLEGFPMLSVAFADGTVHSGYYVETITAGEKKILILMLREDIDDFADKRIFAAQAYAEEVRCFAVPASAVFEYNGKKYVTVLKNATDKVDVEVTVYRTEGKTVYLKTAENEELSGGDEIILKGKKR